MGFHKESCNLYHRAHGGKRTVLPAKFLYAFLVSPPCNCPTTLTYVRECVQQNTFSRLCLQRIQVMYIFVCA